MPLGIDLRTLMPAGLPVLALPAAVTPPPAPGAPPQDILWADEVPPAIVVTGAPEGAFLAVDPEAGGVGTELAQDVTTSGVRRGGLRSPGPWRFVARLADGSSWRGRVVTLPTDAVARFTWDELGLTAVPEGRIVVRGAPPDVSEPAGGSDVRVRVAALGGAFERTALRQGAAGDFIAWVPPGTYTVTVTRATWVGRARPSETTLMQRTADVSVGRVTTLDLPVWTPTERPDVRWPTVTLELAGIPAGWTVFVDGVPVPADAEGLRRREVPPGARRVTLAGRTDAGALVTLEHAVDAGASGASRTRVEYAATLAAADADAAARRGAFDPGVVRVLPDGRRVGPLGPAALARHAATPFLAPGVEGSLLTEFDPVPLADVARAQLGPDQRAFALYVPGQGMQVAVLGAAELPSWRGSVWKPAVPGIATYPNETARDRVVTFVSVFVTLGVLGVAIAASADPTPSPAGVSP